ncbi:death domain-associated protein [Anaeramoeba flamelloides]|uniref:Death domain-associated protein n=1 Tax=Anaeramoeba flamelloides TaxID=1746091 RepID=A0ABQ8ZG15_9EUKA|nr:death domain-associated protein [Anaeramoeba flamelloides]
MNQKKAVQILLIYKKQSEEYKKAYKSLLDISFAKIKDNALLGVLATLLNIYQKKLIQNSHSAEETISEDDEKDKEEETKKSEMVSEYASESQSGCESERENSTGDGSESSSRESNFESEKSNSSVTSSDSLPQSSSDTGDKSNEDSEKVTEETRMTREHLETLPNLWQKDYHDFSYNQLFEHLIGIASEQDFEKEVYQHIINIFQNLKQNVSSDNLHIIVILINVIYTYHATFMKNLAYDLPKKLQIYFSAATKNNIIINNCKLPKELSSIFIFIKELLVHKTINFRSQAFMLCHSFGLKLELIPMIELIFEKLKKEKSKYQRQILKNKNKNNKKKNKKKTKTKTKTKNKNNNKNKNKNNGRNEKIVQKSLNEPKLNNILFIGGTGAGKSTLINYLLGYKFELKSDENSNTKYLTPIKNQDFGKFFKIGYTTISQTLFPEMVKMKTAKNEIILTDSPGFFDNRSDNLKICSSLGIPFILDLTKQITCIVIVISSNSIYDNKAGRFRLIFKTLNEMLKKPEQLIKKKSYNSPILFAITKPSSETDFKADKSRDLIYTKVAQIERESKSGLKNKLETKQTEALLLTNQIFIFNKCIEKINDLSQTRNSRGNSFFTELVKMKLLQPIKTITDTFATGNREKMIKEQIEEWKNDLPIECIKKLAIVLREILELDEENQILQVIQKYKHLWESEKLKKQKEKDDLNIIIEQTEGQLLFYELFLKHKNNIFIIQGEHGTKDHKVELKEKFDLIIRKNARIDQRDFKFSASKPMYESVRVFLLKMINEISLRHGDLIDINDRIQKMNTSINTQCQNLNLEEQELFRLLAKASTREIKLGLIDKIQKMKLQKLVEGFLLKVFNTSLKMSLFHLNELKNQQDDDVILENHTFCDNKYFFQNWFDFSVSETWEFNDKNYLVDLFYLEKEITTICQEIEKRKNVIENLEQIIKEDEQYQLRLANIKDQDQHIDRIIKILSRLGYNKQDFLNKFFPNKIHFLNYISNDQNYDLLLCYLKTIPNDEYLQQINGLSFKTLHVLNSLIDTERKLYVDEIIEVPEHVLKQYILRIDQISLENRFSLTQIKRILDHFQKGIQNVSLKSQIDDLVMKKYLLEYQFERKRIDFKSKYQSQLTLVKSLIRIFEFNSTGDKESIKKFKQNKRLIKKNEIMNKIRYPIPNEIFQFWRLESKQYQYFPYWKQTIDCESLSTERNLSMAIGKSIDELKVIKNSQHKNNKLANGAYKIHEGVFQEDKMIKFEEIPLADQNKLFSLLGTCRNNVIETLLKLSNNTKIRKLISEEIKDSMFMLITQNKRQGVMEKYDAIFHKDFLSKECFQLMQSYQKTIDRCKDIEYEANNFIGDYTQNAPFIRSQRNILQYFSYLKRGHSGISKFKKSFKIIDDKIKKQNKELKSIHQKMNKFFISETIYKKYIESFKNSSKLFGYKTISVIADIKSYNCYIWSSIQKNGNEKRTQRSNENSVNMKEKSRDKRLQTELVYEKIENGRKKQNGYQRNTQMERMIYPSNINYVNEKNKENVNEMEIEKEKTIEIEIEKENEKEKEKEHENVNEKNKENESDKENKNENKNKNENENENKNENESKSEHDKENKNENKNEIKNEKESDIEIEIEIEIESETENEKSIYSNKEIEEFEKELNEIEDIFVINETTIDGGEGKEKNQQIFLIPKNDNKQKNAKENKDIIEVEKEKEQDDEEDSKKQEEGKSIENVNNKIYLWDSYLNSKYLNSIHILVQESYNNFNYLNQIVTIEKPKSPQIQIRECLCSYNSTTILWALKRIFKKKEYVNVIFQDGNNWLHLLPTIQQGKVQTQLICTSYSKLLEKGLSPYTRNNKNMTAYMVIPKNDPYGLLPLLPIKQEFNGSETQIKEIESFLENAQKDPSNCQHFLLIDGPSGVGKTVLSKQLLTKYKYTVKEYQREENNDQVQSKKMHPLEKLFKDAKKSKKWVCIFLDGIDTICPGESSDRYANQIITIIQKEIKELQKTKVIVIGITNNLGGIEVAVVEQAIKPIHFTLPQREFRLQMILSAFKEHWIESNSGLLEALADATIGWSCLMIKTLCDNIITKTQDKNVQIQTAVDLYSAISKQFKSNFQRLLENIVIIPLKLSTTLNYNLNGIDYIAAGNTIKLEFDFICSFLRTPKKLLNVLPNHIINYLLTGPQGTGKSYFASTIAKCTKSIYIEIPPQCSSDLMLQTFKILKQYEKCVVFIDIMDSIIQDYTIWREILETSRQELYAHLLSQIDNRLKSEELKNVSQLKKSVFNLATRSEGLSHKQINELINSTIQNLVINRPKTENTNITLTLKTLLNQLSDTFGNRITETQIEIEIPKGADETLKMPDLNTSLWKGFTFPNIYTFFSNTINKNTTHHYHHSMIENENYLYTSGLQIESNGFGNSLFAAIEGQINDFTISLPNIQEYEMVQLAGNINPMNNSLRKDCLEEMKKNPNMYLFEKHNFFFSQRKAQYADTLDLYLKTMSKSHVDADLPEILCLSYILHKPIALISDNYPIFIFNPKFVDIPLIINYNPNNYNHFQLLNTRNKISNINTIFAKLLKDRSKILTYQNEQEKIHDELLQYVDDESRKSIINNFITLNLFRIWYYQLRYEKKSPDDLLNSLLIIIKEYLGNINIQKLQIDNEGYEQTIVKLITSNRTRNKILISFMIHVKSVLRFILL